MASTWAILIGIGGGLLAVAIAAANRRPPGSEFKPSRPAPPDLGALDDDAFRARVMDAIDAGRKIEAIQLVRERTRLGLAEAKALVEALERGDDSVEISGAAVDPADDIARVALDDPDLAAQLVIELAAGRKIEAIRLLRERTGLGLKEAKDAIEAMEKDG